MKARTLYEIIGALIYEDNASLAAKLAQSTKKLPTTNKPKFTEAQLTIKKENKRIRELSNRKPYEIYMIKVNKVLPDNISYKKFPFNIYKKGENIFIAHDPYTSPLRKTLSSTRGFLNTLWLFGHIVSHGNTIPERPKDFKVVKSTLYCKTNRLNPETYLEKSLMEAMIGVFG